MEVDEDVVVAQLGHLGFFIEFEAVEAVLAGNGPLFCRGWYHCCYEIEYLKSRDSIDGCRRGVNVWLSVGMTFAGAFSEENSAW